VRWITVTLLCLACARTVPPPATAQSSVGDAGAGGDSSEEAGESGYHEGPVELRHGEPVRVMDNDGNAGAGGSIGWCPWDEV
jgi:hypothetical protein